MAFFGDTLDVSADVHGLREGESVTLYYSTADGQSVDQAISLAPPGRETATSARCRPATWACSRT